MLLTRNYTPKSLTERPSAPLASDEEDGRFMQSRHKVRKLKFLENGRQYYRQRTLPIGGARNGSFILATLQRNSKHSPSNANTQFGSLVAELETGETLEVGQSMWKLRQGWSRPRTCKAGAWYAHVKQVRRRQREHARRVRHRYRHRQRQDQKRRRCHGECVLAGNFIPCQVHDTAEIASETEGNQRSSHHSEDSLEPPAFSHESGLDGEIIRYEAGFENVLPESDQMAFRRLSSLIQEVLDLAERLPATNPEEAEEERAAEDDIFNRLPNPVQRHLRILASDSGRTPPNGVRQETLCGSYMWVERETRNIRWKPIVWERPSQTAKDHSPPSDIVTKDQSPEPKRRVTVAAEPSRDCGKFLLHNSVTARTDPGPGEEAGGWDGLMAKLEPVYSGSAPPHLRERALRKRKGKFSIENTFQAVRDWCAGGRKGQKDKGSLIEDFLGRLWGRKRSSADQKPTEASTEGIWDRVGPKNEQLVYSKDELGYKCSDG